MIFLSSSLIRRVNEPPTFPPPPDLSCNGGSCQEILEIMDTSIDPCRDFYQFSCGGWRSKYPRPARSEHWTNFVRLDRQNLNLIRDVLEGTGKKEYKTKWMRKVRKYYGQCKQRDKEEIETVRSFVGESIKDVTVNITRDKNRLTESLASVFTYFGVDVFFKLYIGINDKNSSQHIIKIDQTSFTFPDRAHYVTDNVSQLESNLQHGVEYVTNIYSLLQNQAPEVDKIRQMFQLESNLSGLELTAR